MNELINVLVDKTLVIRQNAERINELENEVSHLVSKLQLCEGTNASLAAEVNTLNIRVQFLDNVIKEMTELNRRRVIRKAAKHCELASLTDVE